VVLLVATYNSVTFTVVDTSNSNKSNELLHVI